MKEEYKKLLLKELSSRLSYGVMMDTPNGNGHLCEINQTMFEVTLGINVNPTKRDTFNIESCVPYLRPNSRMKDDEIDELLDIVIPVEEGNAVVEEGKIQRYLDFMNSHHIDYNNLIEKGLAMEAPYNMYNF